MTDCTSRGVAPTLDDPCSMLGELRAAYYTLMAGRNRVVIRFNDRWSEYGRGDVEALRSEIRRLESMCGQSSRSPTMRPARYC